MTFLPSFSPDPVFWESTRAAVLADPETALVPGHSASGLLAGVQQLIERAMRKRVPRIDALQLRLQQATQGGDLQALVQALRGLDQEASRLDVLAARSGGDAADALARQCVAVTAAANHLWTIEAQVLTREAAVTQVARLLWIELLLEAAALDKRVRRGTQWLAEVHQDLAGRRALATLVVTHRALDELARRARELHDRLHVLRSLCSRARGVHARCEALADDRAALCRRLADQVRAGSTRLQESMQPLVRATDSAQISAADLVGVVDARHELQVALAQAGAQAARVEAHEQELARDLALLAQAVQGA